MAWVYEQCSGDIYYEGQLRGYGYSGHGIGKNNPGLQSEHDVGPIPVGFYAIGPPHDSATHGPFVLPLTPSPDNQMFGRSMFLIHGDSIKKPGTASLGCIITSRLTREMIASSGDNTLQVVNKIT